MSQDRGLELAMAPADRFAPFLLTGEKLLWTGQPRQGLILSGRDSFLIPFSLLWGGFAIFWNGIVWIIPSHDNGPDWLFKLWGLPFLALGLYMIAGRFWHDAAIRKRLIYAVTTQRVLMLRGMRSAKLVSLDIHRLPRLELSEFRDGTGTIAFEANSMFFNGMNGFSLWVPAMSGAAQFSGIADPRQVYELIQTRSRN